MQIAHKPLAYRLALFPRLGLADLPTPLEPMKRLTAHLGGPRLWVKREDATGLGFGGNKLRKLDYRTRPCNFVEIMPRLDEHLRRPKAKGASA